MCLYMLSYQPEFREESWMVAAIRCLIRCKGEPWRTPGLITDDPGGIGGPSSKTQMGREPFVSFLNIPVLGFLLLRQDTITKKQVGGERTYLAFPSILLVSTERSQDRNSGGTGTFTRQDRRQELMQRPWRAAYWLTPKVLLSLVSYRTQGY